MPKARLWRKDAERSAGAQTGGTVSLFQVPPVLRPTGFLKAGRIYSAPTKADTIYRVPTNNR